MPVTLHCMHRDSEIGCVPRLLDTEAEYIEPRTASLRSSQQLAGPRLSPMPQYAISSLSRRKRPTNRVERSRQARRIGIAPRRAVGRRRLDGRIAET